MSLAMLCAVIHYGRAFPWMDDIAYAPFVTDQAPLSLNWLWAPHNEHRIPLGHLFCWATLKLDGGTFMLAKYVYALALSGAAAILLRSLRAERGHYIWTDMAVPLILLGFQGLSNVLWFFQAQFVFATVLATFVLAIMVDSRSHLNFPKSIAAALCVIALPLCGANGLVVAFLLIAWLITAAIRGFLAGAKCGFASGVASLLGAIIALAVAILYFHGLPQPAAAAPPVFSSLFKSATGLMAFGASYAAKENWRAAGITASVIVAVTVLLLLFSIVTQKGRRGHAVSLLLFIGAFIALALAISIGREVGPHVYMAYLQDRYALVLTPLAIGCYVTFSLRLCPASFAKAGSVLLAVLTLAMLPSNISLGCKWGRRSANLFDSFYRDVIAGVPSWLIAAKYQGWDGIEPWSGDFHGLLGKLKDRRMLGLSGLNDTFPGESHRTVSLTPHLKEGFRTNWDPISGKGEITGGSPALRFTFDSPQNIAALRMNLKCFDAGGNVMFATLMYNYKADPTAARKADHTIYVSPNMLTLTKPFDCPTADIVLQIPYGTVKYELTDLIALYPAVP